MFYSKCCSLNHERFSRKHSEFPLRPARTLCWRAQNAIEYRLRSANRSRWDFQCPIVLLHWGSCIKEIPLSYLHTSWCHSEADSLQGTDIGNFQLNSNNCDYTLRCWYHIRWYLMIKNHSIRQQSIKQSVDRSINLATKPSLLKQFPLSLSVANA